MCLQVQGYLVHTKHHRPRTLQQDNAEGPTVLLGGGAVSYERGTPVWFRHHAVGHNPFIKRQLLSVVQNLYERLFNFQNFWQ